MSILATGFFSTIAITHRNWSHSFGFVTTDSVWLLCNGHYTTHMIHHTNNVFTWLIAICNVNCELWTRDHELICVLAVIFFIHSSFSCGCYAMLHHLSDYNDSGLIILYCHKNGVSCISILLVCTEYVHHMARTAQLKIMHAHFGCSANVFCITSSGADQSTRTFPIHVGSDNSNKAFCIIDVNMLAIRLACLTYTNCLCTYNIY